MKVYQLWEVVRQLKSLYSGYEVKPIFCKVYVPKKAKSKYIKWRLKGEKYSEINDLWIKVIGY